MAALVLKEWKSSDKPLDKSGNYILIRGRQPGLLAWVLAHVGVDPMTILKVNANRVEFSRASLAGTDFRMIPLASISSTYYGYHKPWGAALGVFFLLFWLSGSLLLALPVSGAAKAVGTLFAFAVAAGIALLKYFLGRTLALGFVEQSGMLSGMQFKRSGVEGIEVDEEQARYVCEVTQFLIESAQRRLPR
jgi:hypothetical protein